MRKQCLFLLLAFSTFAYGQTQQQTLSRTVYFDFDKANLRLNDEQILSEIVQFVQGHSDFSIYIGGHTDSYGSDAYNEALSRQRVEAVVAYLTQQGIANSHLNLDPAGEKQPIADNTTRQNRQLNRRVVVTATKTKVVPTTVATLAKKPKIIYETRKAHPKASPRISPLSQILPKDNVFHFYCHQDTILVGKDGTKIHVTANSFAMDCGEETLIKLELIESLNKKDMLQRNLYTVMTNGQVLESLGMIHLKAYDQATNQPLNLKKDETIGFEVPDYQGQKNVNIYNGVATQGGTLWKKSELEQTLDKQNRVGRSSVMGWINYDFPCSTGSDYELVIKFKQKTKREAQLKAKLHLKDRNVILPPTVNGKGFKFDEGAKVTILVWEENEKQGFRSFAKNDFTVTKPSFFQRLFRGKKVFVKYESPDVQDALGRKW